MRFGAARLAISLLVPPRCAVCSGPCSSRDALCEGCERSLCRARPSRVEVAGLETVIAAAPYEGTARALVGALKFGRRPALATCAARTIATATPAAIARGEIVCVPPSPGRLRSRGFDPAAAIAAALAELLGLRFAPCLTRADGPRQVGRPRAARLADPPRVRLLSAPPARALVVDDVLTTGATMAACARALRAGGCREVAGLTLARSTGGRFAVRGEDSLGLRPSGA